MEGVVLDECTQSDLVDSDDLVGGDIDWQQLMDELENEQPSPGAFDSRNYPSEEAAMQALETYLSEAMEDGIRAARRYLSDASSP